MQVLLRDEGAGGIGGVQKSLSRSLSLCVCVCDLHRGMMDVHTSTRSVLSLYRCMLVLTWLLKQCFSR